MGKVCGLCLRVSCFVCVVLLVVFQGEGDGGFRCFSLLEEGRRETILAAVHCLLLGWYFGWSIVYRIYCDVSHACYKYRQRDWEGYLCNLRYYFLSSLVRLQFTSHHKVHHQLFVLSSQLFKQSLSPAITTTVPPLPPPANSHINQSPYASSPSALPQSSAL